MDLNKSITNLYKQQDRKARMKNGDRKKRPKIEPTGGDSQEPPLEPSDRSSELREQDCKPVATFDQLYGCESIKKEVMRIVDHFLRDIPGQMDESNWPVLVCGSRGLGKTSIAEAAANYSKLRYFRIPIKTLARSTRFEFGRFQETLKHKVRYCMSIQPAIVLIDDLDRLGEKEDLKALVQESIQELVASDNKLLVLCTASAALEELPEIDFSSEIYMKRPDCDARFKILSSIRDEYKNLSILSDEFLETLASNTPSFSAPDLRKMLLLAERASDDVPTRSSCDSAIEIVKRSFKRGTHLIGQRPSVTWSDIGGMSSVRRAFINILRQTRRGGVNCKFAGVALYGPPGCGKTMVAQAMANEGGFNFISIKPAELINKFLGETEKNIRKVFHEAREHEPCMIYFDEFDGLCGTRGNKDNITSAVQTLLAEMDGFVDRGKSIILASTNRLEDIDPAMKRPGRLSKHIYVGPPDEAARKDILRVITSRPTIKISPEVDLSLWAKRTQNFTGAELGFLVEEAESRAYDLSVSDNDDTSEVILLQQDHLEFAFTEIKKTNKELNKKTNQKV